MLNVRKKRRSGLIMEKGGDTVSLEENKAVVRRLYKAFDKRNLGLLDELVAHDYIDHPRQFRGRESYKQHLTTFFKSFPDSHETIEDIIAEGDRVWVHVKGIGTHKGEFRGIAPTGKKIKWGAVSIWRIVDGKIAEMWCAVVDELDSYKQLGIGAIE